MFTVLDTQAYGANITPLQIWTIRYLYMILTQINFWGLKNGILKRI